MRLAALMIAGMLVAACSPTPPSAPPAPTIVRYVAEAKFETVTDDLEQAILAKGLVIDSTSRIAQMLDRTGKDVGSTKTIYADGNGQAYTFCSATLSRKMMEADPNNIVFCPFSLAVYRTAAEPAKVYVAYQRPLATDASDASRAVLKEVEALLDALAREALHLPAQAS